ncbi:ATP-binding protein [Hyalangium versicolor]|uniref:ATP-binding protein n=1 Tax=Hyalangium versicolor TaxID=2861190 RepID=UPI001CCEAA7C|nr:ATP-binding protein [Hyalangium versicolor]
MPALRAPHRRSALPYGLAVLLLALAYALLGIASLKLAIPPYLATIFMPSVGVGLAGMMMGGYRMAPGVWLGASALSLWLTWKLQGRVSPQLIVVAVFSGLAATLQVSAGLFLIRRFVGREPKLQKLREILSVLGWGGPVACVINASITTLMLRKAGVFPPSETPIIWLLFWVCDTIGVLVMLPLTLAVCGWPAQAWTGRRHSVLWPVVVCLAGTMVLFTYVARFERSRPRTELTLRAEGTARVIEAQVKHSLHSALAMGRSLELAEHNREERFRNFVRGELSLLPGLGMVAWASRVVTEGGTESFPLTFVEPASLALQLRGSDLLSEPVRRQAVLAALARDELSLSAWLQLPGQPETEGATLAILPLHDGSGHVDGVLAVALRPQDIIARSVGPQQVRSLAFSFWDMTGLSPQRLGGSVGPQSWEEEPLVRIPLEVGGRRWELRAHALPGPLRSFSHWQLWGLMVSCLLFTALLAVLLMEQGGEKTRVASLVAERTETLHQRELFLSTVLQSALDGLLTLDEEGRVHSANPAACRLLGLTGPEWEGRSLVEVLPSLDWASLSAELDGLSSQSPGLRRETHARRWDGTEVPVEVALSNASTSGRRTYVCLLHDVSERTRVIRMKDEFVSTVSHELRTPLTSILGALSLINRGGMGEQPDVAPQLLTIAETNAQRLLHLINDLLDVDKMEAGELALRCRPAEVSPLLARAQEENRGYAERFQVTLRLLVAEGASAWAEVDEGRFGQVMSNLLSNAIKFSPSGGMVEVGLKLEPAWVEVSVRDHGAGIPVEFQPLVFRKFSQADSSDSRRQRGTGLGLYLTRMLVERMRGDIRFETAPDQGTTFFVRLPRIPAP